MEYALSHHKNLAARRISSLLNNEGECPTFLEWFQQQVTNRKPDYSGLKKNEKYFSPIMRNPEFSSSGLVQQINDAKDSEITWLCPHNYKKAVVASTIISPFQQEERGCSKENGWYQYLKVKVLLGSSQKTFVYVSLTIILPQSQSLQKGGWREKRCREKTKSSFWHSETAAI